MGHKDNIAAVSCTSKEVTSVSTHRRSVGNPTTETTSAPFCMPETKRTVRHPCADATAPISTAFCVRYGLKTTNCNSSGCSRPERSAPCHNMASSIDQRLINSEALLKKSSASSGNSVASALASSPLMVAKRRSSPGIVLPWLFCDSFTPTALHAVGTSETGCAPLHTNLRRTFWRKIG